MPPEHESNTERLLPEDGLFGSELRRVRVNNRVLQAVRAQQSALCTLLAETRWLELGLGRKEYGQLAGIDAKAVQNSETLGAKPEQSTYTRIHGFWQRKKIGLETRERLLRLVAVERYEDPPEEGAEPGPEDTVVRLYRRWSVKRGMEKLTAAADLTDRGLWQREKAGIVPDFAEVRRTAAALREDQNEAMRAWMADKLHQLRGREVPDPLAQLMVRLETGNPRHKNDIATLRRTFGCTSETATKLLRWDVVPFTLIEKTARGVIPEGEWDAFEASWRALELEEGDRDTFGKAFERVRDDAGYTNRELAVALDIRSPEERGGTGRKRKEAYRPSHLIREVLANNGFSSAAPAGVLIGLVARPDVRMGERDEPEPDYLRRLFLEQRERWSVRTGKASERHPLQLERTLWGVDPRELADAVRGMTAAEIAAIEQGTKETGRLQSLIRAVEGLGQEQVQSARMRLEELRSQPLPETVAECVQHLKKRTGGYLGMRAAVGDDDAMRGGVSVPTLKAIEEGRLVPPLPLLRRMLQAAAGADMDAVEKPGPRRGADPHAEHRASWGRVRKDWLLRYPTYMERHPKHPQTHPLTRFLGVVIGERYTSAGAFMRDRMPEGFDRSNYTRDTHHIHERNGIDWHRFARYLDAGGVAGPRRRYAQILNDNEGDIEGALAEWLDWAKKPWNHLPALGLTEGEWEDHRELIEELAGPDPAGE